MKPSFRITGVGGIFFKCKDPAAVKAWHKEHLGFHTDTHGTMFSFREADDPQKTAYLQWSPFPADTDYFGPPEQSFMLNYRVEGIEALVEKLEAEGVTICDAIETYSYGKFVHILGPEGEKIELWEPTDELADE